MLKTNQYRLQVHNNNKNLRIHIIGVLNYDEFDFVSLHLARFFYSDSRLISASDKVECSLPPPRLEESRLISSRTRGNFYHLLLNFLKCT